ncbi:MAG: MerR family transcriptional regulator [Acidobacteria bacterium]|nr:MerR family transcriptional regulator [Acidobacteriota bacterium]
MAVSAELFPPWLRPTGIVTTHTNTNMNMKKVHYSPSELSREVGISSDALRFYEKQGLLPAAPRRANGRRVYPVTAAHRVRVIRAALSLGFTVADLQRVFRIRDTGGAPCETVYGLAMAKLAQIEQTISQLSETRDLLSSSIKKWRRQLASQASGQRLGLLDHFAASHPARSRLLSPRIGPGLRQRLTQSRKNSSHSQSANA